MIAATALLQTPKKAVLRALNVSAKTILLSGAAYFRINYPYIAEERVRKAGVCGGVKNAVCAGAHCQLLLPINFLQTFK